MGALLTADLLSEVTSGISTVIGWIATVISALFGTGLRAGQLPYQCQTEQR